MNASLRSLVQPDWNTSQKFVERNEMTSALINVLLSIFRYFLVLKWLNESFLLYIFFTLVGFIYQSDIFLPKSEIVLLVKVLAVSSKLRKFSKNSTTFGLIYCLSLFGKRISVQKTVIRITPMRGVYIDYRNGIFVLKYINNEILTLV